MNAFHRFIQRHTWQIEAGVVLLVLLCVIISSSGRWVEYVGAIAVFFTFMHAQVADHMAEEQANMPVPSVECYKWSQRYFYTKEAMWLVYFISLHAWSALVGVGVFLIYPVWRKYYRSLPSKSA